ncbi:MAG TPA: RNA methyltransferase [Solirubrobacteraceae bacterium]|jgi:TrmH family RNA methyltransferase
MTITSPHNPHLKDLRRLARRRERERAGRFAAEGEDLILAAQRAGWPALEGYRVPGCDVGGAAFDEVAPDALAAVSTLGSGTRAIGVYEQRWLDAPTGPLCVYLHGVRDPGNVGTVLRSALAFGASCVTLGPGCADPYGPKAVRASMGAIFAVALARIGVPHAAEPAAAGKPAEAGQHDETVPLHAGGTPDPALLPGECVALVAGAGEPLMQLCARLDEANDDGMPALTLLVGSERAGLPEDLVEACEHIAHIPIAAAESLNAAMAATVALYETTTRRSTRVRTS